MKGANRVDSHSKGGLRPKRSRSHGSRERLELSPRQAVQSVRTRSEPAVCTVPCDRVSPEGWPRTHTTRPGSCILRSYGTAKRHNLRRTHTYATHVTIVRPACVWCRGDAVGCCIFVWEVFPGDPRDICRAACRGHPCLFASPSDPVTHDVQYCD